MRLWLLGALFTLQRTSAFATPRRVSARHRRMPTAAADTVDGERAVVREVAGMALPLLLVSLSSPLLSLIDVAVVGRHVGVLGLASLGPATSVCDLSMYVFNALSVSTTRLAAAALADGDETGAARNVGDGAAVAVLLGITYGAAVALVPALFLGPFLPQAVDARALPLAVSYTRVRALGFPAALLTVVLQSAALARRDVRTPLKAVWLGALVNGVGDYVLVARCGAGVAGAAAATVAAQCVASGVLLRAEARAATTLPRRLADRARSAWSFLIRCAAPALALSARLSVQLSVAATASACGTAALAAQQALSGTFQIFRPLGDALGQTMQALLPAVASNNAVSSLDSCLGLGDAAVVKTDGPQVLSTNAVAVLRAMIGGALALGLIDAALATAGPVLFPGAFTADALVAAEIRKTAPIVGACLFVHALSVSLEGVLFATNDAKSVAKLYIGNALAMGLAFSWARARGPTLSTVWGGFFLYNIVRCAQFSARLAWNQRDRGARWRRKRDVLAGWALAPKTAVPVAPVYSTSYAARKYSSVDYDV